MSQHISDQDYGFIGRAEEIQAFIQWMNDPAQKPIFYIHDASILKNEQGGVGKTRLLRKLYNLVEQDQPSFIPVLIDFFSPEDRDGITIARRVVKALQERYPQWNPAAFEASLEEYYKMAQSKHVDVTALREQLSRSLSADVALLEERMSEEHCYLLLFFDTFERIEDNPAVAVMDTKNLFPDDYQSGRIRAVVAGRNAPQWPHPTWEGRKQDVLLCPLAGFSLAETREYLLENAPTSVALGEQPPEIIQGLHTLTEGRPILLALLVDILKHPEIKLAKIVEMSRNKLEETLVQLLHLIRPVDEVIYFMAHISHRFDISILETIASTRALPQAGLPELFARVMELSVVRTSSSQGDVLVLHDEMRRLVNDYCWPREDPKNALRSRLSTLMVEYYNTRLAADLEEELRASYLVERLFHALYLDLDAGLASFSTQFKQALTLSQRTFARALLQEVKKFDEERVRSREKLNHHLSTKQRQDLKLAEAELLLAEENPQAALLIYEELERDINWVQSHASDLFYGKADCYFKMGGHAEAIGYCEACLQIEQDNVDKTRTAELYNTLGLIARRQSRYREARDYYLNSLNLFKSLGLAQRYASVLNNLGNAYRLLGEPKTGLLYCRRGLLMREHLYEEGQIGPIPVGLSHFTLGHIYHTLERLPEEELHYRKAFEIFEPLGFRSYLASAYSALGKIWVAKNDLDQAFAHFTRAYELAKGVSREAEIESLNQQGRVLRRRKQWPVAAEKFAQAAELAQMGGQSFSRAENLLYLADVRDRMGQPAQSQIDEARKIAPNEFMQGRAEEIQGDIYYRHGEYQAAFERYAEACKFVALYGQIDFLKILRKLEDQLLAMPEELLSPMLTVLMTYWSDQHLDEQYPEFSAVCRLVQSL